MEKCRYLYILKPAKIITLKSILEQLLLHTVFNSIKDVKFNNNKDSKNLYFNEKLFCNFSL